MEVLRGMFKERMNKWRQDNGKKTIFIADIDGVDFVLLDFEHDRTIVLPWSVDFTLLDLLELYIECKLYSLALFTVC